MLLFFRGHLLRPPMKFKPLASCAPESEGGAVRHDQRAFYVSARALCARGSPAPG